MYGCVCAADAFDAFKFHVYKIHRKHRCEWVMLFTILWLLLRVIAAAVTFQFLIFLRYTTTTTARSINQSSNRKRKWNRKSKNFICAVPRGCAPNWGYLLMYLHVRICVCAREKEESAVVHSYYQPRSWQHQTLNWFFFIIVVVAWL